MFSIALGHGIRSAEFAPYIDAINYTMLWMLIVESIALFLIFRKAGEKPWKAFIPLYNWYILYKVCWSKRVYWQVFFFLAAACVMNVIEGLGLMSEHGFYYILGWYMLALAFGLTIHIMMSIRLAKSFGHSAAFGLGLAFFQAIFYTFLALSLDAYKGPTLYKRKIYDYHNDKNSKYMQYLEAQKALEADNAEEAAEVIKKAEKEEKPVDVPAEPEKPVEENKQQSLF